METTPFAKFFLLISHVWLKPIDNTFLDRESWAQSALRVGQPKQWGKLSRLFTGGGQAVSYAHMGQIFDLLWAVVFRRLFWISPKVRRKGQVLLATSNWRTHLFTLGAYDRAVLVDAQQKAVRVRIRSFWFFVRWRRFPFSAVRAVTYGYVDLAPGQTFSSVSAYQSDDVFTVALNLVDGKEFPLFRFYGPGEFVNESFLPDWMYWEDQLEARITKGPQESESLAYAGLVSQIIGVPLDQMEP